MAEKKVHHGESDGDVGASLLAGIMVVALLAAGVLLFAANFNDGKDVNVSIEPPATQTPGGEG